MHTQADIRLSIDGKTATLTQNNKQLIVRMSGAGKARFSVMPASYLPGVELPLTTNSENAGFKKLCIRLDDTDKAAFMVEMMPLQAKGKPFKKLRKW